MGGTSSKSKDVAIFFLKLTMDGMYSMVPPITCNQDVFEDSQTVYEQGVLKLLANYQSLKAKNPKSSIGLVITSVTPFVSDGRRLQYVVEAIEMMDESQKMVFDTIEVSVQDGEKLMGIVEEMLEEYPDVLEVQKRVVPGMLYNIDVSTTKEGKPVVVTYIQPRELLNDRRLAELREEIGIKFHHAGIRQKQKIYVKIECGMDEYKNEPTKEEIQHAYNIIFEGREITRK